LWSIAFTTAALSGDDGIRNVCPYARVFMAGNERRERAMALAAIIGGVGAAAEAVKAFRTVYEYLDGSRSCVITIKNRTDQRLTIIAEQSESGGYKVPPDQYVDAMTFQTFGAQDKGFMTGAIGSITYRIGDENAPRDDFADDQEFAYIRWANPFIGANAASSATYRVATVFRVVGAPPLPMFVASNSYEAFARAGSGEVGAEMLFELYPHP
jgi:hypothetical protein